MEEKQRIYNDKITNLLLEMPQQFEINGSPFFLYPTTLGKRYLMASLYEQLDVNKDLMQFDPTLETMRVIQEHIKEVCKIISYHTFCRREDICNAEKVLERAGFFEREASIQDLTKLFLVAEGHNNLEDIQNYLGITKEHRLIAKVNKIKENGSSIYFCGTSIFGELIVPACEKLNLTPMQVIWEISYDLLRMLMSDAIVTMYLTEEERKKVHIPRDRTRIDADSKEGLDKIKKMNWD